MKRLACLWSLLVLLAATPSFAVSVGFYPVDPLESGTFRIGVEVSGLGDWEVVSSYDLAVSYGTDLLSATGVEFSGYLPLGFAGYEYEDLTTPGSVYFGAFSGLSTQDLFTLQSPLGGTVPLATLIFQIEEQGDFSIAFEPDPYTQVTIEAVEAVPLPGTLVLLASGLGVLGLGRRRAKG